MADEKNKWDLLSPDHLWMGSKTIRELYKTTSIPKANSLGNLYTFT